jgi:RNA polymerase sigma-70 factor (ECF subfamily)
MYAVFYPPLSGAFNSGAWAEIVCIFFPDCSVIPHRMASQIQDAQLHTEFEAEALPHMNDLFRTALRLLLDQGEANDAVQETYLVAWKTFHKYERGTNCRAWLFQILFNVARHERRKWFRFRTGKEEDFAEMELASPQPVPTALTDGDILAALDKLSIQFREVLMLVDVDQFSYKEAGEILGVPIGTVMSRLSRARTLLRGQLADVARSYGLSTAQV